MSRGDPIAGQHSLDLDLDPHRFAYVRCGPTERVPEWAGSSPFLSVTRTADELSILCHESAVPASVEAQRGFRSFQVRGPLAFSQVGVLDSLAHPLAGAGVSIMALSTFDTDYLLVAQPDLEAATQVLEDAGHVVRGGSV